MQVNWRSLLSSIHVEWRDRGANCRAGNVNIACPWCGNDPSFHLAIAESREAFYCYREPGRHSGRSFISLLVKLRINRGEAARLLNSYLQSTDASEPVPARRPSSGQIGRMWDRNESICNYAPALHYLKQRGIERPSSAAIEYDLRFAPAGAWANRLLIPFYDDNGKLITFTGRALRLDMQPRYLTQPADYPGMLYTPDHDTRNKKCLVLVEGPFDALKLAIICKHSIFLVTALLGKDLNASRLLRIRELSAGLDMIMLALDSDVTGFARNEIISALAGAMRNRYIAHARLPPGRKDPAELDEEEGRQWLKISHEGLLRQRSNAG